MRAGRLRHRVDLQAATRTDDGYGGGSEAWTTFASAWAEVNPSSGTEVAAAGAVQGQTVYEVRLRYRTDLGPQHRIVHGSRVLWVQGVTSDPRRNLIVATCVERFVDGAS